MPMNHGQSRQSTRWYKLCFIPTSGDSSDDSDTESVIIAPNTPTQTSTWNQPSPPHPPLSPPNLEPEIDLLCLPPPPLPDFFPLSRRSEPLQSQAENPEPYYFPPEPTLLPLELHDSNPEPQINRRPSQPSLLPSLPPNPEPQINWSSPLPPPPPPYFFPPSPTLLPLEFQASNPEPRINLRISQPPPPPPPSLPWNDFFPHMNNVSSSVTTHGRPDNDQSEFLQIPDSVINAMHMVRISKLHLVDELSHCPICMEEFKLGDEACQLPCNHTYKFKCILRWLNTSKTCPVCRLQLDGFEGQESSHNIGDDEDSLDLEPQIPPQVINNLENLFQSSPVREDGAGENSDEAEYDSACDDDSSWY